MHKKAYVYRRVSTLIQVDGNSLEGQLKEIEKYCKLMDIEIMNVYSDEGKSGKSIAGRPEFQRMIKDIKSKEEVDYVIVWKLSRFGRNAKDTLNSLEILQSHGVELYTVVERIDSGEKMGKFLLTMLSSLAEMERENIIEQTKIGKKYNALDGKWNGGAAPYGYRLDNKKLVQNKDEAEVVKKIFDWFVNTDLGYNGVTAKLNREKIPPRKTKRLDRKAMQQQGTEEKIYLPVMEDWGTHSVKKILDSPIYCGKMRWGYENVIRENGKERRVKGDDEILEKGNHEGIISEELWNKAQKKRKETGIASGRRDSNSENIKNTFNGIAKCPNCGSGMVAHRERYKKSNGEYSIYYRYICGYYNNHKSGKCQRNTIKADYLEGAVIDELQKYIRRPNVIEEITKNLGKQLDTSEIKKDIDITDDKLKELDKQEEVQYNVLSQIGVGRYANISPERIEINLGKIKQQRDELENFIERKKQEIEAIEQDKLNVETIKYLIENFDKVYNHASNEQQKKLIQSMVKEVKLGYWQGTKKVVPLSMILRITGEQIELFHENSKNRQTGENLELSNSNVEVVIRMQNCGIKEK